MADETTPTSPEATPGADASQPELGWAPRDDKSFWSRVKEVIAGAPSEKPAEPEAASEPLPSLPPVSAPKPRKVRRTAFDKARAPKRPDSDDSRRTRLRRAADEKRDGLALVVGEKVEKVLVEKLETRDEELKVVAQGFVELSGVLGGLGRSMGSQEERARTLEETLRRLPEADREQAAALAGLARALGEQAGQAGRVAQNLEGVPEIASLVKQGAGAFQGQLVTLREVQRELELQRDQRERIVEGVHKVERALLTFGEQLQGMTARQQAAEAEANAAAARFERALQMIGQRIAVATDADDSRFQEARIREQESVARLERAAGAIAARLDQSAREESDRAQTDRARALEQAERLERGLTVMAARVHEQSSAIVGSQEDAAETFRRSQESVVESFEEFQERTVATMERLHEERAAELARSRRRVGIAGTVFAGACLAALGFFGFSFVQAERERAQCEVAAERARAESAIGVARARAEALFEAQTRTASSGVAPAGSSATTLPAGFGR